MVFFVGAKFKLAPAEPSPTCISRDELEKLIDDHKLQTLLQSYTDTGKVHEIMFTPLSNGELFIIEYDKVGSKNKKYCVLSKTSNTNINEVTVDELYNALERVRGHRA